MLQIKREEEKEEEEQEEEEVVCIRCFAALFDLTLTPLGQRNGRLRFFKIGYTCVFLFIFSSWKIIQEPFYPIKNKIVIVRIE